MYFEIYCKEHTVFVYRLIKYIYNYTHIKVNIIYIKIAKEIVDLFIRKLP